MTRDTEDVPTQAEGNDSCVFMEEEEKRSRGSRVRVT